MATTCTQQSSEGAKGVLPTNLEQHSAHLPGFDSPEPEALWAKLDRCRTEYDLGHVSAADLALRKVMAILEARVSEAVNDKSVEGVQMSLLCAAGFTLQGRILDREEKRVDAQKAFEKAIELFERLLPQATVETIERSFPGVLPVMAHYYSDYGVALHMVERKTEATVALERAIKLGDTTANTYCYLGLNLQERKEYAKAENFFNKALHLNPTKPRARQGLAEVLHAQGRIDEAATAYQQAASAWASTQRLHDALNAFDSSLALKPDMVNALSGKGQVLYSLGRYKEALAVLDRALELSPDHVPSHATKGAVLDALGRYDEALQTVNKALNLRPDFAFALAQKGDTLLHLGRPLEALQALDQAASLAPNVAPILHFKGMALSKLRRYDEAIQAFDKAFALEPDNGFLVAYKGEVLRLQGKYEEALKSIDQALALIPADAWILGTKGQILRAINRNEEAVEVLQRSIRLDSGILWVQIELANALNTLNRHNEALETLDHTLKSSPESYLALAAKGETLRKMDRDEDALEAFNQALAVKPDYAFALSEKGEILCKFGHYYEALEALEQALTICPQAFWALGNKGEALRMLGQNEEAMEAFNQALALEPDYAFALAQKGEILRMSGQHDAALQALEHALSVSPENFWAMASKGATLRSLGRYKEALQALDQALALRPNNYFALGHKGETLFAMRRYEEALKAVDQALMLFPRAAWILEIKGRVLQMLGRTNEAVDVLQRSVVLDPVNVSAFVELSAGLRKTERYEEARKALDQALALRADDPMVLGALGELLSEIGEYEASVRHLARAAEIDPSVGQRWGYKGWALENLGPQYAQESLRAYEMAVRLEFEDLWWHKGVGNALYLLNKIVGAATKYRWVIEQLANRRENDVTLLSLKGWCHYRLGQYDEALRLFYDTLSIKPDRVSDQFDLALVLMCSGEHELAMSQYELGLKIIKRRNPLRQRGWLSVALNDLRDALRKTELANVTEALEAYESLKRAL